MFTKKKDVRRMRIPRNADKRRNLHCGRAARVYGVFNETAYPLQCD